MRVLNSGRGARIGLDRREAVYLTVGSAVALATESTARAMTNSDLQDALGVAVWAALVVITALDHARQPLRIVAVVIRLAKRVARCLPWRPVAIDLRGDPPIEQGMQRMSETALLLSLVGVIGLGMVRHSLPVALRESLVAFSPTLWSALLGGMWAVVLFCTAVLLQQPSSVFVREFSTSSYWRGGLR